MPAGSRGPEGAVRETVRSRDQGRDHGSVLADRFDTMTQSLDRLVTTLGRKKRPRHRSSSSSRSRSVSPACARRKGKTIDRTVKRIR